MPHIRILRHYIPTPFILLGLFEGLLAVAAAYLGYFTRYGVFPENLDYLIPASVFALVLVIAMGAMGVYESRVREGMVGMSLRTAVSVFFLGTAAMAMLSYFVPPIAIDRSVLLFASIEAFVLIILFRWIIFSLVDDKTFKKRVVVIGTGQRALKIATRMRRRSDQRSFVLVGFLDLDNGSSECAIDGTGANIIRSDLPLKEFCREYDVHEFVIAMDERRRNQDAGGGLPLESLMDCRLSGINVCDVQQFIEREACKVDVDLLRTSWMVFSDGFIMSAWRAGTKRGLDLTASVLLLAIAWPVMLVTAFFIGLESHFKGSIFYRQTRTGFDGKNFDVIKFRSMSVDTEAPGQAVWATEHDSRVTRVGSFIRNTRIDELPQLFNVFKGDMSFVGPRPERPVFVDELTEIIPFYNQRHRVKPGITGWAQLCYPYGASVEDAKEKLQYDLYYLKNHSILLDLIILLQTIEVVLIGEGAR